jgi:sarcosine oxidase subunit alpha
MHAYDLIVVGAGPAGMTAAAVVSGFGGRVLVLDESTRPGGRLPGQAHPGLAGSLRPKWSSGAKRAGELFRVASSAGARFLQGVSVWGLFPGWFFGTTPADPSLSGNDGCGWFKARAALIATGAAQNALALPGWTLPGVITAGAAQNLITVHRVRPGRSAVVIGVDPLAITTALVMSACGVEVRGVLLPPDILAGRVFSAESVIRSLAQGAGRMPQAGLKPLARLLASGAPLLARLFPAQGISVYDCRWMINRRALTISAEGSRKVVRFVGVDRGGRSLTGSEGALEADTVVTSAGLYPLVELCSVAGCALTRIDRLGGWVPLHNARMETTVAGLFVAGSGTGIEGAAVAEAQGRVAGLSIARFLSLAPGSGIDDALKRAEDDVLRNRARCFPFLAEIAEGRAQMETAWSLPQPPKVEAGPSVVSDGCR